MRRLLVQRSHTECGVSKCHHESSTIRRSWSLLGRSATGGSAKKFYRMKDASCMSVFDDYIVKISFSFFFFGCAETLGRNGDSAGVTL